MVMNKIIYSAVIRTFNSEKTLPFTLEALRNQTNPPHKYIFVDSGSTDRTLQILPEGAIIHYFAGEEFNYSKSLNQGLEFVSTDYVLIISSHTLLPKCSAIEFALDLLDSDESIGAAYFDYDKSGELRYALIDKNNFDGFNGLWNTCAVIKMALLKRRSFLPEVFAAEDQEWSTWLFHYEDKMIARISGAGMKHNRDSNPKRHSLNKRLNEYVAIAYYSNRDLLKWINLVRVAFKVVRPMLPIDPKERFFNLLLLPRLLICHFVKPKYKSRYF
jgi:glycosyltransferase involved in cell wall biosynthesis